MKTIEKCKICEKPFWQDLEWEKREGTGSTCSDCIAEADRKAEREMNKPLHY